MNAFEKLIAEYEKELRFEFNKDLPEGFPAVIVNRTVYLNPFVSADKAITYLAEEIGHHKTLATGADIIDQKILANRKMELKGREWGYRKLVPKEKIIDFIKKRDQVMAHDLAEAFDVPPSYIEEVVNMYKSKGEL